MTLNLEQAAPRGTTRRTGQGQPPLFPPHSGGARLLQWLLSYPFQRAEDLAVAQGITPSTAYHQIKQCEELGLLESVTPSLGPDSCRVYHLGARGLLAAAQLQGADPAFLAQAWGADERGLLRLLPRLHTLMYLQDIVNALVARAPIALAPAGARKEVNWHWRRDYRHAFISDGRPTRCTADAALVLHLHPHSLLWSPSEERYYSAFLLVDAGLTGNHDERVIRDRLELLLRYRECEERIAHHRYYPPVLVVVQSARQREIWQKCAREVAEARNAAPLAGAVAYLAREQQIASAWPLPWSHLSASASCRLEEVFQPMPREALPAGLLAQPRVVAAGAAQGGKSRGLQLKGGFAARAKEVSATPCAGAAEREAVALLGLALSRRHLDVVHALYTHPLLSRWELAALMGMQEETLERYLSGLRRVSCLAWHETTFGLRLRLSSRGLRLVAAVYHISIQHIATPPEKEDFPFIGQHVRLVADVVRYPDFVARPALTGVIAGTSGGIQVKMDQPLPGAEAQFNCIAWRDGQEEEQTALSAFLRDCALIEEADCTELVQRSCRIALRRLALSAGSVRHTGGLYGFFARLQRAADAARHRLLWWETGSRCECRYRDHDSWHNLRPDAAFLYEAGERRFAAWLEWDEGTMSRQYLEPKMKAYATFVKSREWVAQGMRSLPLLLIVSPYKGQEQRIIEAARAHLAGVGLVVYTTTATRVSEAGPLAPIWAQVLPVPPGEARRRLYEPSSAARTR